MGTLHKKIAGARDIAAKLKRYSKPVNGCWEWQRCKNENGYGEVSVRGKNVLAHRAAYAEFVGPIPAGYGVCHTCDNPSCINPEHLFLGDQKDNTDDMLAKQRHTFHLHILGKTGLDNPRGKLSNSAITEILAAAGTLNEIAARFGVSRSTIKRVRSGERTAN